MKLRFMVFVVVALCASATALADIAPGPGLKQVTFSVRIDNMAAAGDQVLLVYPWSMSFGAPTAEVAEVRDGRMLRFGSRIMGTPMLYAMPRSEYQAWRTQQPRQPAEELFASDRVTACGVTFTPVHVVSTSGPSKVVHTYRVENVAAGACRVAAVDTTIPDRTPSQSACSVAGVGSALPPVALLGFGLALFAVRRLRRS